MRGHRASMPAARGAKRMSTYWVVVLMVGLAAIGGLLALMLIVRRFGRRNRLVAPGSSLWEGRDYRCPACRTPMERGYALAGRGLIWAPLTRPSPGTLAHIGQALDNTLSLSMPPDLNMAWHCAACRLLVVDHAKLVRSPRRGG